MIRYYGEQNVPGAPGQALVAGSPSFDINRRSGTLGGRSGEQLKRLYEGGTQQNEKLNEELRQRNILPRGVNLPLAQLPPGMPGAGGMAPMGNAGALGGGMGMGPRFGPRPLNMEINAVDDRIESIGGSTNIQLDDNQTLRFGGGYNPGFTDEMGMQTPNTYSIYGAYETPGFGFNVNYRNTGRGRGMQGLPGMGGPGGFPGEVQAGFRGKF